MAEKLKREFIDLLERDVEFRYTVAGYIGLSEILKRLDRLEEGQNKLWEGQNKLWEGQNKLWKGQNKLWEGQNKLWEEVRNLRREMTDLRRETVDLRREVGGLSATVGAISEGGARRALREWLRDRNLAAEKLRPLLVTVDGEELEINFHGYVIDQEGRRMPIYAEAKSTIKAREIKEFSKIAREAEKNYGEGLKAIIAYRIYEDAYKAAEEEQIHIIEA